MSPHVPADLSQLSYKQKDTLIVELLAEIDRLSPRKRRQVRGDVIHKLVQPWLQIVKSIDLSQLSYKQRDTMIIALRTEIDGLSERKRRQVRGDIAYKLVQPWLQVIKSVIQMITGLGIFSVLFWRGFVGLKEIFSDTYSFFELPILKIVGYGLAYSAGIELVYMLFTDGPDEAIDPAILGIAAAILITTSYIEGPDLSAGLAVTFLVTAMVGLFFIKRYLYSNRLPRSRPARRRRGRAPNRAQD